LRAYMNFSIDQLKLKYDEAVGTENKKELKLLREELENRRTTKAKELLNAVNIALGGRVADKLSPRGENKSGTKPPRKGPKPTDEQAVALSHFAAGYSFKINAYAGAGKTSTLQMLAHSSSGKRGQYIAFNRDIVLDAKNKFPENVHCSTTHGLAFREIAPLFKGKSDKLTGSLSAKQLCEILDLKTNWQIDKLHLLKPESQSFLILETIKRFSRSGDEDFKQKHVPRHGSLVAASTATISAVEEFALQGARHVWSRMKSVDDVLPLGHDGYLKLWALSKPRLLVDFILLDEAQDTNAVVLGLLKEQQAQMIYVGDKFQQIYEWRGAINAMDVIETDRSAYLSQSFRFGPSIAEAASTILRRLGSELPLRGNPAVNSKIGLTPAKKTIVARTNAATITEIIRTVDARMKPHLVGGTGDLMSMLKGVQDLKEGRPSSVPDFFGFSRWGEVQTFAQSSEGEHLLTFVNLVDARGEKQLMWALNQVVEQEKANVTISTVHRAKGREWQAVQLADDFVKSDGKKQVSDEELRILYVAMTRAKTALELPEAVLKFLNLSVGAKPVETSNVAESTWTPPKNWQPSEGVSTSIKSSPVESKRPGFFSGLFNRK